MSEISYLELKQRRHSGRSAQGDEPCPPVTLVYGDEALCEEAVRQLLDETVPEAQRTFRCEQVDGAAESMQDICDRLNTYSLLSGGRVVVAMNPNLFAKGGGRDAGLRKARQAFDEGRMDAAADRLLRVLGTLEVQMEDIAPENRRAALSLIEAGGEAGEWIETVLDFCLENEKAIPAAGSSDAEILRMSLEKGFPGGNRLVVVMESVDRRSRLFRAMKDNGLVVDCSVPKGDRQADRAAQEAVLRDRFNEILGGAGKEGAGGVFEAVVDRTGVDLRTFAASLEKLVSYAGDHARITVADVESVLKKTRMDPLYEFTGAVAERDLEKAFVTLQSLLDGDFEPLQILAAIANQVRKLLIVREFLDGPGARLWRSGMNFNRFRTLVYPAIQAYDEALQDRVEAWKADMETVAAPLNDTGKKATGGKRAKFALDDLLIAKSSRHPYPVYQDVRRADRFSLAALCGIVQQLAETDVRIKSSGQDPVRVLEMLVFQICPPGDPIPGGRTGSDGR